MELGTCSLTARIHSQCHVSVPCSRTARGGLVKWEGACSGDREPALSLFPFLSQAQHSSPSLPRNLPWLLALALLFLLRHVCILLFRKHSSLKITSLPYKLLFPLITKFHGIQRPCADLSILVYFARTLDNLLQSEMQLDLEIFVTRFCSFIYSFIPLYFPPIFIKCQLCANYSVIHL